MHGDLDISFKNRTINTPDAPVSLNNLECKNQGEKLDSVLEGSLKQTLHICGPMTL